MSSGLYLFSLTFVLVAKGVEGADGDLNAACLSGNTCTDTTNHACDTDRTPNVCKIKQELPCTDVADCVAGSTCTGTPAKCTCDSSVATTATLSGKCPAKTQQVTGACADDYPCHDPNASCAADGKCACSADGYVINYINYSCIKASNGNNGNNAATMMHWSFVLLLASFLTSRCL